MSGRVDRVGTPLGALAVAGDTSVIGAANAEHHAGFLAEEAMHLAGHSPHLSTGRASGLNGSRAT